ncbi:LysR family transcriptional regulator [Caldimonas tepidiphila]|uniref:LysR family transcriptional regulator n=1 Tax=Caldimonas tepidiphila TaxID=2315841 RepID=UPI000E5C22F9|nr:LysR family transcriptional regulator [Caldimonas tepidiphila]
MDPARLDLNQLPIFLAVAQAGGFTAAAARLGLSKAKVSFAVARLEQQVGASLFTRTTRRVSLTETGRALYERCAAPLAAILDSVSEVQEGRQALAGALRIACTSDFLAQGLAGAIVEFMRLHPLVQVDLRASDQVVHPVETGIDLAFRVGWLRDSSQRAVRLGDFGQVVAASPAYLQRLGAELTHPEQLVALEWVALSLLDAPLTWTFTAPDGSTCTVRMRSRLRVDSARGLRTLIEGGAGVAVLDSLSAEAGLREGRLLRLLPQWQLPAGGIHAVYPPGRGISPLARAFVEFYRSRVTPAPARSTRPKAPRG